MEMIIDFLNFTETTRITIVFVLDVLLCFAIYTIIMANKEIEKLKNENNRLESRNREFCYRNDFLNSKLVELEQENNSLTKKRDELNEIIRSCVQRNGELKKKLKNCHNNRRRLGRKLKRVLKSLKNKNGFYFVEEMDEIPELETE